MTNGYLALAFLSAQPLRATITWLLPVKTKSAKHLSSLERLSVSRFPSKLATVSASGRRMKITVALRSKRTSALTRLCFQHLQNRPFVLRRRLLSSDINLSLELNSRRDRDLKVRNKRKKIKDLLLSWVPLATSGTSQQTGIPCRILTRQNNLLCFLFTFG